METVLYETFYEVERKHWWCVARRDILDAVTASVVSPGARLLDVGCGTGFFLEKATERYDAWGVDASPLAGTSSRNSMASLSRRSNGWLDWTMSQRVQR